MREAVEEKLSAPQPFAEVLAPVHHEFSASGMTETELDTLLQSTLDAARRDRRPRGRFVTDMAERAVFDCMLFLQAATNAKSPAFKCFELAEQGLIRLQQVNPAMVDEVHDVLN